MAHTCQCLCPSELTGSTCEQVQTDTGKFMMHASNGNVKTLGNKKSNNGFVERNTERLKRHNFRKKLFAYFDFVMVFNFFDHKVESRAKLQIVVIDTQTIKQELKLFLHIN